uniref:NAD-dependent protein deacetylase n=1 Tax=Blastobotrys adeninivorans TaxID=409370 RepID=A0A060T3A6_BLAAD
MVSLEDVATSLANGEFKRVVFMVGAGVSTAAGIPDFRSPETGLYANLARLKLPYPEAVFDLTYFRKRPEAFYTLADELYPGKFEPTKFHSFMKVVQDHGCLLRVFTQNIDTLEHLAGVDEDKIVAAHGSFANNHCIECRRAMSVARLKQIMWGGKDGKVVVPKCEKCGGLIKPDIVFFGESLPRRFFDLSDVDVDKADLVIVAGTSLTVMPFAQLPDMVPDETIRVLFNMEQVGDFGDRENDVVVLGDCDDNIAKFADMAGWSLDRDTKGQEPIKQIKGELNSIVHDLRRVTLQDSDKGDSEKDDDSKQSTVSIEQSKGRQESKESKESSGKLPDSTSSVNSNKHDSKDSNTNDTPEAVDRADTKNHDDK